MLLTLLAGLSLLLLTVLRLGVGVALLRAFALSLLTLLVLGLAGLLLSLLLALAGAGILRILLLRFGRRLIERELAGSSGNLIRVCTIRAIRATGTGTIRGVLIEEAGK